MSGYLIKTGVDTAGGTIQPGGANDFVYVDGALVGVLGDPVDGHGPSPHDSAVMEGGSSYVFINGTPVTVGGVDKASCGDVSVPSSHVMIDG